MSTDVLILRTWVVEQLLFKVCEEGIPVFVAGREVRTALYTFSALEIRLLLQAGHEYRVVPTTPRQDNTGSTC